MCGTIEDIRFRCIPCSSALCLPLVVIDVGAETPPTWVEWRTPWGPNIRMRKGIVGEQPDAYGGTKFFKIKLVQAGSTIETAISALYIRWSVLFVLL